jgi:8-oxo-dGTP pyrophosphatase MutT (NUDIX family)
MTSSALGALPPAHPESITETGFRAAAARCLLPEPPSSEVPAPTSPGDFDLNPELKAWAEKQPPPRPAAVLVPVVKRDVLTVLFTERTAHLPSHAGQISFPGGKIDEGDGGPLATALREAEEEIGLAASFIEPLGYLDPYSTGTGYRIVPVVALVSPGFTLQPNPGEVADVFEVPLSFLLEPRNYVRHTRAWQGRERAYYAVPYNERYIWGATAGMLNNFHTRLSRP